MRIYLISLSLLYRYLDRWQHTLLHWLLTACANFGKLGVNSKSIMICVSKFCQDCRADVSWMIKWHSLMQWISDSHFLYFIVHLPTQARRYLNIQDDPSWKEIFIWGSIKYFSWHFITFSKDNYTSSDLFWAHCTSLLSIFSWRVMCPLLLRSHMKS